MKILKIPVLTVLLIIISASMPLSSGGPGDQRTEVSETETSSSGEVLVPAGEDTRISLDIIKGTISEADGPMLPQECEEAVSMVPEWMRVNLTHKFDLLPDDIAVELAGLIADSPETRYRDEIGFCIAHSTVGTLTSDDLFPEIFTHNAELIYGTAPDLDYVEMVEMSDHTTVRLGLSDGTTEVLPREMYYWYIVHPKLSDELPTYVDPDYNYAEDPPFSRDHGTSPPTGKFWREWFYENNKTGQPLLSDSLSGKTSVLDAIRSINGWVSGSMQFTSDNERPNQPVRIYQKGIGRCGEYQDMRCAAARTALIPVLCTSNAAEDHVWNEFWDGRWVHWDGSIDRPFMYEKGWGKTISSVWNVRGDNNIWSVTSRYTEVCNVTIKVTDNADHPVEGALVEILTENFYQQDMKTTTISGTTDINGVAAFDLGDGRNYWVRVDGGDLGQYPPMVSPPEEIVMGSEANKNYSKKVVLPRSLPELRAQEASPMSGSSKMVRIDMSVDNSIVRGRSHFSGDRFDLFTEEGVIDIFLTDDTGIMAYDAGLVFQAWELNERTANVSLFFDPGDVPTWTLVLSNSFSQYSSRIVSYHVSILRTAYLEITGPLNGSVLELGHAIEVEGRALSDWSMEYVEVSIGESGKWFPAESVNGEYFADWAIHFNNYSLEPGPFRIYSRGGDGANILECSIPVEMVDTQAPDISVMTPGTEEVMIVQEETLELSGFVWDNHGPSSLSYRMTGEITREGSVVLKSDGSFETYVDTFLMDPGQYNLILTAEDPSGNIAEEVIAVTIMENTPPDLEITSPIDDSLLTSREPIPIKGSASDNMGIASIILSMGGRRIGDITDTLSEGSFEYSWDASGTRDGAHTLKIEVLDSAGNSAEEMVDIILDGTGPNMEPMEAITPLVIAEGETPLLELDVSDPSGVASVSYGLDGGRFHDVSGYLSGDELMVEIEDARELEHGDHYIEFGALDELGNSNTITMDLSVDGRSPEVSIGTLPDIIGIGENIDIVGSVSDDRGISSVHIEINGGAPIVLDPTEGDISERIGTERFREGENTVSLIAVDTVGNTGKFGSVVWGASARTDSDGDGIPDLWEAMFEEMDHKTFDSDRDLDDDGYTNLQEYLGKDGRPGNDDWSDPLDPDSVPESKTDESNGIGPVVSVLVLVILIASVAGVLAYWGFSSYKKGSRTKKYEVDL